MGFYPKKVSEHFHSPQNVGVLENADTIGNAATFLCGVSVRVSLRIDENTKQILAAKFKTNGCGFVIATANIICEKIVGEKLTTLHGLEVLEEHLLHELEEFPADRKHCADICFDAIQNALAKYRNTLIEEWSGEKALICTCFGVSEESLEQEISTQNLQTVEEVGDACNAGTGCGSCQPLIQEVLDSQIF